MVYLEQQNRKRLWLIFLLLIVVFIFSLFLGRYTISPLRLMKMIKGLIKREDLSNLLDSDWRVFYYIRLPRVILVTGVGAVLSITGVTYQSIFRNPLVSPNILGVSAGASFGVALGMLISSESFYIIYLLAFVFGIVAMVMTYLISILSRDRNQITLILAGIIVTALFNAFLSILKYLADPYEKLPGIVFWLMGGFSRTGWVEIRFTLPFMMVGSIVIYFMRWYLNVMSMGEEEAISMGINVRLLRFIMIIFTTLMVAVSVATAGQISWIGLLVPHIARYLIGTNHRFMLPAAAILGSSLLLVMDDLARTLTTAEIPISIITALIGAPLFAYLLINHRESGWN